MQTVIGTCRRLDSFHFEVISNIQDWNKKIKTYSSWCPFQGLSNGTTLMVDPTFNYKSLQKNRRGPSFMKNPSFKTHGGKNAALSWTATRRSFP
jgi:hypothetical protein